MVKSSKGAGGAPTKGKDMQAASATERGAPQIDPRIQSEIGKHLRAHYDDVVNEPVPDKFMELLAKLEKSVGRKS